MWGGEGEGGGGVGTACVVRVWVLGGDRAGEKGGGCGGAPLRVIRALGAIVRMSVLGAKVDGTYLHDDATMAHTGIRTDTHWMCRVLLLLQHRIL